MTKVVIIKYCRLKQRQSSAWLVERVKSAQREGSICTGVNIAVESRGTEDGKR